MRTYTGFYIVLGIVIGVVLVGCGGGGSAPVFGQVVVDAIDVFFDNTASGCAGSQVQAVIDEVETRVDVLEAIPPAQSFPSGGIIVFAGTTAPSGWMLCDGSLVSRTTYANLFTTVGETYGSGDGSTTFALPDMRQRFPLGKADTGTGNTLGSSGGTIDHNHSLTLTLSGLPAHHHAVSLTSASGGNHNHGIQTAQDDYNCSGGTYYPSFGKDSSNPNDLRVWHRTEVGGSHTHQVSGDSEDTGSGNAVTTESSNPPFVVVNYIIKL